MIKSFIDEHGVSWAEVDDDAWNRRTYATYYAGYDVT